MPNLTRRALPASAAALALLGANAAQAMPLGNTDAELIRIGEEAAPLVAKYTRLSGIWWTLTVDHPDLERCAMAMAPIHARAGDAALGIQPAYAGAPAGPLHRI